MATIPVQITYFTGLKPDLFSNVRLTGSWDENGLYADSWTSINMKQALASDGCPCFQATIELDESQIGKSFNWGVILDSPAGENLWGIATETNDGESIARHRTFTLKSTEEITLQQEQYYLTNYRRLGAQKYYPPGQTQPGIQFSVWAPNAQSVEVVFANSSGYIADDGTGIDESLGGVFSLSSRRRHLANRFTRP